MRHSCVVMSDALGLFLRIGNERQSIEHYGCREKSGHSADIMRRAHGVDVHSNDVEVAKAAD